MPGTPTDHREVFRAAAARGDHSFLLRLYGKYGAHSVREGAPLIAEHPATGNTNVDTNLAAVTRWAAARTGTPAPAGAATAPSPEPVFGTGHHWEMAPAMRELIRSETPPEIAALNVWLREREFTDP